MAKSLALTFGGTLLTEEEGHPNEMKFRGMLVPLDVPSDKPPNGADGHRILVPSAVARRRLKTLIGMGLNYDPDLDSHNQRRKVGVIKKAEIEGNELWVEGVIWKHDFPEAQKDLKRKNLGMSMEINQVQVKDMDAEVWTITDLCFLGATILYKDAAAYHHTRAIAAKAEQEKNTNMATATVDKKKVAAAKVATIDFNQIAEQTAAKVAASAAQSNESFLKVLNAQTTILAQIAGTLEGLQFGKMRADMVENEVKACEHGKTGDCEACNKMNAAKHKDDEEDDDDDHDDDDDDDDDDDEVNSATDEGDLDEMGSDLTDGPIKTKPGHLNEDTKNKGRQTEPEEEVGKTVETARVKALRKQIKLLSQKVEASEKRNLGLEKKMQRLGTQVSAAAADTKRHSMSAELTMLLGKSGINAGELQASGTKISTEDSDRILAAFEQSTGVKLDTVKRMELKNRLYERGMLDDGAMDRGYGDIRSLRRS